MYKDKKDAELFEEATLSGSLVKTISDKKQMRLVAINSAKWAQAKDKKLRFFLALLHNGIPTENNKDKFAGIDMQDPVFENINNSIKVACAKSKYQEYRGNLQKLCFCVIF